MDAGTAYTAQTYNLTGQFLPKEWIMEKWEEGFYITAMAGSNSGWSLVAMSKGTPYTQQSYKVCVTSSHVFCCVVACASLWMALQVMSHPAHNRSGEKSCHLATFILSVAATLPAIAVGYMLVGATCDLLRAFS